MAAVAASNCLRVVAALMLQFVDMAYLGRIAQCLPGARGRDARPDSALAVLGIDQFKRELDKDGMKGRSTARMGPGSARGCKPV